MSSDCCSCSPQRGPPRSHRSRPRPLKRFLVVPASRAPGSTWLTKYSPLLARCPGVVTTGEALHPLTERTPRAAALGTSGPASSMSLWRLTRRLERPRPSVCGNQPCVGCRFFTATPSSWLRRAARNRHRHAMEQGGWNESSQAPRKFTTQGARASRSSTRSCRNEASASTRSRRSREFSSTPPRRASRSSTSCACRSSNAS